MDLTKLTDSNRRLWLVVFIALYVAIPALVVLNDPALPAVLPHDPFVTPARLDAWLQASSAAQLVRYGTLVLTWDMLLALASGILAIGLAWLGLRARCRLMQLALPGLAAIGFDLLENLLTAAVAFTAPPSRLVSPWLLYALTAANWLKWLAYIAAALLAAIAIVSMLRARGRSARERVGMLGDAAVHLYHIRLQLFVVLAGVVLAFSVDQMTELFFVFKEEGSVLVGAATFLLTLILGVVLWLSARTMYRFRFAQWPSSAAAVLPGFKEWAPRLLGATVPWLMAVASVFAARKLAVTGEAAFGLTVYGFAFFVLFLVLLYAFTERRRFCQWLGGIVPGTRGLCRVSDYADEARNLESIDGLSRATRLVFVVGVILNGVVVICSAYFPNLLTWMGPLAIILLATTFFVLAGTVLIYFGTRLRVPILSGVLIAAVLFHYFGLNDNHYVRQCPEMDSDGVVAEACAPGGSYRPQSLVEYLAGWLEANDIDPQVGPIYLVSAEGGGIRAAAWTALVLAHLEEASGGAFSRHMFAGSGVSGGSLGLATFAALVASDAVEPTPDAGYRTAVEDFLTVDFLGPTLTNMLLIDQLQRFVPLRAFVDRGQRLEEAWERAWDAQVAPVAEGANPFAAPFVGLYREMRYEVPLLFLNATVVQDGRRFIQHPLTIPADTFARAFPAALDASAYLRPTTPLSAVVHNSARFTYVSPAGTIPDPIAEDEREAGIQVVDGGYFENSGAATLGDIYRLLIDAGVAPTALRIIHISNDPGVEPLLGPDRCGTPDQGGVAYGEITAPLLALLNTRSARGLGARDDLRDRVVSQREPSAGPLEPPAVIPVSPAEQGFYHFRLCELDRRLPLGWTLSDNAVSEMEQQLGLDGDADAGFIQFHRDEIDALVRELKTSAGDASRRMR